MTLPELRKRLRFWMKVLDLASWKITVRWAKRGEIPDCYATIRHCQEHDAAEIIIHRNMQYSEWFTLHELNHLLLIGIGGGEPSHAAAEEVAVNRLTRALAHAHDVACPPVSYLFEHLSF